MITFIYGKWHAWEGVAGPLLSDEDTKELRSFKNWDEVINWLWLSYEQPAARTLNEYIKQAKAKNAIPST